MARRKCVALHDACRGWVSPLHQIVTQDRLDQNVIARRARECRRVIGKRNRVRGVTGTAVLIHRIWRGDAASSEHWSGMPMILRHERRRPRRAQCV